MGCDNLWNEKLREGMWKETDVSLFGYGGRKRLHSLLDSRRKNLQKGFSSTPRPQADFVPEGHVIFSLAVIVCLSICCALAQLSVRMIVTPLCLPVQVSTTRRAEPTRLLSTERKSRAFVSGRKIALAAGFAIAASLVCRQPRRPVEHGTREETWR